MAVGRVELHIEELVLHGFAPADRARIGDAVQAELARLLAASGGPQAKPAAVARLDAGAFQVKPGSPAESVGRQVASRVHQSLVPPRAARSNS
jgi:hypothetical protein